MKLELVAVPVTDLDRAKAFYVDQVGFHADHDHQVTPEPRFVQLTPPWIRRLDRDWNWDHRDGTWLQRGLQVVVDDVEAVPQSLAGRGVETSDVAVQPWGCSSLSATLTATPGRCSRSFDGSNP